MRIPSLIPAATLVLLHLAGRITAASAVEPWKDYVFSPATRNPAPVDVHSILGDATVRSCGDGRNRVLRMKAGSRVTVDFGVEVGGHVSFGLQSAASTPLSLAFTESPSFIRNISDDTGATPSMDWDGALEVTLDDNQLGERTFYHTPPERFRGGFRFLTFNALEDVHVYNISCEIGFAPNMPDLRAGTGYFYTSDKASDILNRMFYAGVYTVQTCIAPNDTGRFLPQVRPGWAYNATLGVASPSLLDGAKRDRAIWPGDLGLCAPVAMMGLGEFGREAIHNSLETVFYYQNKTTGLLPYAGPSTGSFLHGSKSDTYHAWGLIMAYEYAMYSGDAAWLERHWDRIEFAVDYIVGNIDETGLQLQVNEADWARRNTGGYNSALNALGYHVLVSFASLATDESQASSWRATAEGLKSKYNELLWDDDAGLYRDNLESDLHAQDGNAMALLYGLPESASQRAAVSEGLERNWNDIGPVTPELEDTISPFISGIELLAHYQGAENPARASKLLHRLWGYLLDGDLMTGSTFAEGITANGSLYYRSERGYKYDAAYTSLSHAWSSVPSSALVLGALGLRITGMGGETWELRPQLGDLTNARAGFETGLGWFEVVIELEGENSLKIDLTVPPGTKGAVVVPDGITHVALNSETYESQSTIFIG